jgi:hypothetical protein
MLKEALKSQYHASLAMLRDAIERCPDTTWYDPTPVNAFWQVAYHTVFFAHAYLQHDRDSVRAWPGQQPPTQNDDGIAGLPDPESELPLVPQPYTKSAVLEYWEFCDKQVDAWVDALDLTRTECGFRYPLSKLEHQFVNVRHIQHHAAQLGDRLRAAHNIGIRWVGKGSRAQNAAAR